MNGWIILYQKVIINDEVMNVHSHHQSSLRELSLPFPHIYKDKISRLTRLMPKKEYKTFYYSRIFVLLEKKQKIFLYYITQPNFVIYIFFFFFLLQLHYNFFKKYSLFISKVVICYSCNNNNNNK